MGRITAGTAYARAEGITDLRVWLNGQDFDHYERANADTGGPVPLIQATCDGAKMGRLEEDRASYFTGRDRLGAIANYPLMTDAQYLGGASAAPWPVRCA